MKNQNLELIPFATSSLIQSVENSFLSLGYNLLIRNPHTFLLAKKRLNNPLIFLLAERELFLDDLLNIIRKYPASPCFGILHSTCLPLDSGLVNRFDEFVSWPCHQQELSLRLRKLMPFDNRKNSDRSDSLNIDPIFLELNLVGKSPVFIEVLEKIKKVANCGAPVLIEGKTGTGKELAARAIHYTSERKDRQFIPVNCGALPDNLIENELFGHERGAYTDARTSQNGLVAQADGGTLFLDEIDSLSPKAQITLLRFLQDKTYLPLGANKMKSADVRIIAATNKSLLELVENEKIREDLFYRLNIMFITMPSLDERKDDISLLAEYFVDNFRELYQQKDKYISSDAIRYLERRSWPGNVRELENYIHRGFLMSRGDAVEFPEYDQGFQITQQNDYGIDIVTEFKGGFSLMKANIIADFEQRYLGWALKKTKGNVSEAARLSGKDRRAFGKLIKKYGINKNKYST